MQCSSLENEDVDTPFNYIAQQVYLSYIEEYKDTGIIDDTIQTQPTND